MHIGIDGRLLLGQLTGIGRYTLELSKKIIQKPNNSYSFYTPMPFREEIIQQVLPCNIKTGSSYSRLSRVAWAQTKLPYWAGIDKIDLFWGPSHRLPQCLPKSIARVVTIHDLVWKFAHQTMRPLSYYPERILMSQSIKIADLIIADSESTRRDILGVYPDSAHKVRVVHLGASGLVDISQTTSMSKLGIEKPFFLFVGTLEPRKNLKRLLKAFSLLSDAVKRKYFFVIAGGKGWGSVDLKKLITQYGLQDSVKVLGYVTDSQLALLYANARFLVMPSIYEGFGLPLVESMSYGTPVLTSNISSMPEIAGEAGIFVDPLSVDSIAAGLYKLLNDNNYLTSLRLSAMLQSKKFTWDKCAHDTYKVFEEAIHLRAQKMLHYQ